MSEHHTPPRECYCEHCGYRLKPANINWGTLSYTFRVGYYCPKCQNFVKEIEEGLNVIRNKIIKNG